MKALFINPPTDYSRPMPSLGISFLSAYLKSHNHESRIIDLWAELMSDDSLRNRISEYKPDMIGIPFFTALYKETVRLIGMLKASFPDTLIVVGGPHASALPTTVLNESASVDLVVIGEGEETILEIMQSLGTRDFSHINGIAFRNGDVISINPERTYIKDIDSIPYPDLEYMSPEKYKSSPPYGWYGFPLIMITSRGCPSKCTFCCKSVYGGSFRAMSPERIVAEIKHWKSNLPIKEIRFYDDDFTISNKRIYALCDLMIKEKINLPWSCTTRVDFLTRELLAKMKEAGLYFISLGVESGSERVLKSLKKRYKLEHIRNAFQWCHSLRVQTLAYFLVGNPEETIDEMTATLELQREIKPGFSGWGILEVFPGSPLFEECRNKPGYQLDIESGYRDFYRNDMDEGFLRDFCLKAMVKNYLSYYGAKSMLQYLYKTKNFSIIRDHLWLKFKSYSNN